MILMGTPNSDLDGTPMGTPMGIPPDRTPPEFRSPIGLDLQRC